MKMTAMNRDCVLLIVVDDNIGNMFRKNCVDKVLQRCYVQWPAEVFEKTRLFLRKGTKSR